MVERSQPRIALRCPGTGPVGVVDGGCLPTHIGDPALGEDDACSWLDIGWRKTTTPRVRRRLSWPRGAGARPFSARDRVPASSPYAAHFGRRGSARPRTWRAASGVATPACQPGRDRAGGLGACGPLWRPACLGRFTEPLIGHEGLHGPGSPHVDSRLNPLIAAVAVGAVPVATWLGADGGHNSPPNGRRP